MNVFIAKRVSLNLATVNHISTNAKCQFQLSAQSMSEKTFKNKGRLKTHRRVYENNKCDLCNEIYETKKSSFDHESKMHRLETRYKPVYNKSGRYFLMLKEYEKKMYVTK